MDDDVTATRGRGNRGLDDGLTLTAWLEHPFSGRAAHVNAVGARAIEPFEKPLEHSRCESSLLVERRDRGGQNTLYEFHRVIYAASVSRGRIIRTSTIDSTAAPAKVPKIPKIGT